MIRTRRRPERLAGSAAVDGALAHHAAPRMALLGGAVGTLHAWLQRFGPLQLLWAIPALLKTPSGNGMARRARRYYVRALWVYPDPQQQVPKKWPPGEWQLMKRQDLQACAQQLGCPVVVSGDLDAPHGPVTATEAHHMLQAVWQQRDTAARQRAAPRHVGGTDAYLRPRP